MSARRPSCARRRDQGRVASPRSPALESFSRATCPGNSASCWRVPRNMITNHACCVTALAAASVQHALFHGFDTCAPQITALMPHAAQDAAVPP